MHCFLFWLKLFVCVGGESGWRIMRKYIHFINGEKDEPMSTMMLLPHHVYTHGKNTCQINSPACLSILSIRVAESINHDTPNLYLLCASKRVLFMLICDWFPLFHHSTALFEFFASFLLYFSFPIHFKIVFSTHHLIYCVCMCVCVGWGRLAATAGLLVWFT